MFGTNRAAQDTARQGQSLLAVEISVALIILEGD